MSDQTEIVRYQQMDSAYAGSAIVPSQSSMTVKQNQIALLKTTLLDGDKATDDELQLYGSICNRTGLDPFARQIYGIRYKGKLTFQVSIDGYRLIADRTGKYAGSDDPVFDDGLNLYQALTSGQKYPTTATVTVWKIVDGKRYPFTATASWQQYANLDNYGNPQNLWKKMPHLMLSKCAEALALRKAFPAELSGLYTGEEMESIDNPAPVEVISPPPPKPQIKSPPNANSEAWRGWKSLEDAIDWAVKFAAITKGRAYEIYESIQPEIIKGREVKAPRFEIAIRNLTDVF